MTINFKSDWGLNIVSALYFTRTIDFKVGKTYVFNAFFREKVFRAKVFVEEITTIKTKYGKKEVIVIVPIMKYGSLFSNEKSMKVYLSNDKYRVPMRVSVTLIFGSFIGNLVSGYPGEELK